MKRYEIIILEVYIYEAQILNNNFPYVADV